MKTELYKEYCTGCGLCQSVLGVQVRRGEEGYAIPQLSDEDIGFCREVCPAGGKFSAYMAQSDIWGKREAVYYGWATDDGVRKEASSGGILTAVCCDLLERKEVDGIIQTRQSGELVYRTKTVISRTPEEVMDCKGSRYCSSSPLSEIKQILRGEETYAFVGKPCDVDALRLYCEQDPVLKKQIKYMLSFFCAGVPSDRAQELLLSRLGCQSAEDCTCLSYRGNGWPGFATAIKKDGAVSKISYEDSWGSILGRDVRKSCRFCLDGIGELADISCGDAWYLTDKQEPDFTEADGRNVIFARTKAGERLLKKAVENKRICLEEDERFIDELQYSQKYQFERRATMGAVLSALKIGGREVPEYHKETLRNFSGFISGKSKFRRFAGTLKRILLKKI